MITEGLKLMVIGMTIVYIFLIILMLLVMLSARVFKQEASSVPDGQPSRGVRQQDDIVAVISAAISRYKSGK